MFTGIIESLAKIKNIDNQGSNLTLTLSSDLTDTFKVDQSICHNGICLTIESILGNDYQVTAIQETILKTSIKHWKIGDLINLEKSLTAQSLLDGHIVQGHVDCVAKCINIKVLNGSWEFSFSYPDSFKHLIIEKGSICINGTSLTAFNLINDSFSVAIIPYTYQHTNINTLEIGTEVNLEFDILGKYLSRHISVFGK